MSNLITVNIEANREINLESLIDKDFPLYYSILDRCISNLLKVEFIGIIGYGLFASMKCQISQFSIWIINDDKNKEIIFDYNYFNGLVKDISKINVVKYLKRKYGEDFYIVEK